MTQRNNFLLILKQNPGIDYNELLNRITSEYGSINSARAALSRTLKDLAAIGVVQRQANKIFVTDKGLVEINSEMKNKLLTRLNESMASKNPVEEVETIVKMLQTLIERSKADNDLLKAAKTSSNFYISDLLELKEKTDKRAQQLKYLSDVLLHQITALKELNFNDFKKISLSQETIPTIFAIIEKQELQQIRIECTNPNFANQIKESLQAKTEQNNLVIEKKQTLQLLALAEKFPPTEKNLVKIYLPGMQIKIENQQAYLIAPSAQLQQTETGTTEKKENASVI
ncbi:MAG: hypothetical protein PHD95_00185 [Candidatus ainarchaeum sp.]|nr:hypothetical protein [Candidatus ainarchaeum sp.]